MQVSIRELKNHLSKYLRLAKIKKTIIITSHRTPLAKLTALNALPKKEQQLAPIEGIKWNGKKPQGNPHPPKIKGKTAAEYILEERE